MGEREAKIGVLVLIIVLTLGCLGQKTTPRETTAPTLTTPEKDRGYANPDVLIDSTWLQTHLTDPKIKIIDLSPTKNLYDDNHVPSAFFIDRNTAIADPENPIRNMVAPKKQIEKLLAETGIERDDTIVVYDEGSTLYAGRLYWVLKYYGHKDIRILEGGKKLLETSKFELTDEESEYEAREYIIDEWNPEYRVTLDYVLNNLENSDIVFLDVRSPEEYEGTDIRAARGGHIPGAVNVDWKETVNSDGTIKNAEELRKLYESRGVTPDKNIITYCSSGVRGAYSWFVLKEILGYPDVTLYAGSWEEWGNNFEVPVVTGKKPGAS